MKGALYTNVGIEEQPVNSNSQTDTVKEYRKASKFAKMLLDALAAPGPQTWLAHKEIRTEQVLYGNSPTAENR